MSCATKLKKIKNDTLFFIQGVVLKPKNYEKNFYIHKTKRFYLYYSNTLTSKLLFYKSIPFKANKQNLIKKPQINFIENFSYVTNVPICELALH